MSDSVILILFSPVHQEGIEDVTLYRWDDIVEFGYEQVKVLVHDERVDDDGCLEGLLYCWIWLRILPLIVNT